jgi:hypothetical protein
LPDQVVGRGVEGALNLDVTVRVDGTSAYLEDLEVLFGQWLQRRPLHLQEVGQHLAAG